MADDVRLMVGRNVKRLRLAAKLTQAALAERLGVDRDYVSGLELGQRNPTIVTLWHIAKALEVTIKTFLWRTLRYGYTQDGARSARRSVQRTRVFLSSATSSASQLIEMLIRRLPTTG